MKRKLFTRIGAAVLTAAMLLTGLPEGAVYAGAKSAASAASTTASTASASSTASTAASTSSTSGTDEASGQTKDTYASKRLIVRTGDKGLIDTSDVLARYGNVYLLQYGTEEETEKAYKALDGKADAVAVDTAVSVAADATTTDPTDTVMTKTDNPLAALKDTDDTDTAGKGVIALIDTGAAPGGSVTDAVSMLGGDAGDDNGHGTAMVKDITAQDPDAKILSIKAIGADGKGDLSAVYAAMEYAISQKVSYINLSVTAWKSDANALLESAVEEADKAGITVIGAAGNDGLDASNFVPGAIDKVVTVGACDSAGTAKVFSNFGSSVDYYADADSTSDAAATVTGYLSKHGMATLGNAKPLIFAAKDATGNSTYVIPDGATDGPQLNEVVSFYEDDGSGKYDIRLQDYIDGRIMKTKIYNGEMVAPVVFSRLDLPKIAKLEVFTGFMDPEKETDITDVCTYDANTGLVHIPEKYKDTQVTVRYYMSDKSQMYDYMFADLSGETFTIANDDRGEFDLPASTIARDYIDNVSNAAGLGFVTSEGHAGFYNTTEDISNINENDIFVVTNGQTAISTAYVNPNAIYEMNIPARTDPRNKYGVIYGHSTGDNIFLNHFTTVLGDTNGSPYKDKECRALEHIGETGSGKLKVATNSGQRNPDLMPLYNEVDGWLVGYCCYDHLNGKIPVWNNQYSRIKCIRKTVNADGSIVEYFYYQMSSMYCQYNAGIFALKYVPQTRGRVAVQVQKVDENGNKVAEAGFQFSAYVKQGVSTSTNVSDYTYIGSAPTNSQGLVGLATGKVGTGASSLDAWKQQNPTWTFLIQETAVPENSKYQLNSPNNPVLVTVNLANTKPDSLDPTLFWANGTATFTPNKNKGSWSNGTLNFADPENKQPVKGSVAIILQKSDAETDKDVDISGFTFDVYYAAGKLTSTDKSKYTKLGTNLKTDKNGQIGILASNIGTEADTYADWVKQNPEWTFLIEETGVPADSGYELNTTPSTVTVETADTDVDGDQHIYYLDHMFYFKNIPIVKKVRGSVGLHLQKKDASTGKDLALSGFTFDVYYTNGSTTSTSKGSYTYLGSMTTDTKGQAAIKTGKVGTAELTYDDWVKNNKTWTFLVEETSVPADSGYVLNPTPMTYTVDLTKATADKETAGLYWGKDTAKFANTKITPPPTTTPTPVPPTPTPTTTPPAPKTPTIKTTATSSGSHDVMLNEKTLETTTVTISDVIALSDLESGTTYTIKGELHNAETGKQITTAKASDITFKATGDTATQTMTFTVPAKDVANVKTVVYEYLYNNANHKQETFETNKSESSQTVSFTTPGLATSAKSGTTGQQQADALSTKETVVDTVKYSSLQTGKSYTVKGTLMLKASDKDTTGTAIATAEKTFTPNTANGSIDLTFTYDATKYVGKTVVAFEELQQGGVTVATHKDLTDTAQSVYIPSIGTKAAGTDTGIDHQVAENGKTITDTVSYTNLLPETTYKLAGTLVNKATGKEALKADATFTTGKAASGAATVSGTADVVFKITDASAMEGNTFVAYETLSLGDTAIAEHKDLTDAGQTVYLPKVETQVKSDTTSTQAQFAVKDTKITDTVNVSGLKNGQTYVIKGTLMDKATGKAVAGVTAAPAEVKFTANATTSTQTIQYTFDSTDLEGHVLVVFEDLYAVDSTGKETLVGKEEDLQSKTQAMLLTPHGPTLYAGGTGTRFIYIAGLGLAAVAVILVVLLRKKRKPNA